MYFTHGVRPALASASQYGNSTLQSTPRSGRCMMSVANTTHRGEACGQPVAENGVWSCGGTAM
jgi:hypothetical protein